MIIISRGKTELSINPLAYLSIFNMNVGGALITVGDETIASGSRLEVANSLANNMVIAFSSISFLLIIIQQQHKLKLVNSFAGEATG